MSLAFQGKYAQADPAYLEAIEIQQQTLGPDHADLATTLNGRALLFKSQVRFAGRFVQQQLVSFVAGAGLLFVMYCSSTIHPIFGETSILTTIHCMRT